jgi:poly(ADP-ribose) glycohydrolase ARH3
MLANGADYRSTGRAVYPDGSFANWGAMRIAPVGLAFRHAEEGVLREAVKEALLCTHMHPDAVDGAFIQAKAVAHLVRIIDHPGIDVAAFLSDLRSRATTEVVQTKLEIVLKAHAHGWSDDRVLAAICTPNEYGEQFQIHAAEALACAQWAFACCHGEPEECIIRAVSLGGDTDTVAAMAGALAGALHGSSWLPRRWFEQMENQPNVGRDYLIGVAQRLAELDLRSLAAQPTVAPGGGGIK